MESHCPHLGCTAINTRVSEGHEGSATTKNLNGCTSSMATHLIPTRTRQHQLSEGSCRQAHDGPTKSDAQSPAVAIIGRDAQDGLFAKAHLHDPLVPAFDHLRCEQSMRAYQKIL